jgi:predicted TIM-barrel fold metal-dependent hydrolase
LLLRQKPQPIRSSADDTGHRRLQHQQPAPASGSRPALGILDVTLKIDTHHHIVPPFYFEEAEEGGELTGGLTPPPWSPDAALEFMDSLDIDVAITSISTPGVHLGDDEKARHLARRCNEYAAELVSEHPTRFGAFAILPLPDLDGSLAELAHSLDTLELDGVCLMSNAGGRYLGDPAFKELFQELQRREAVVFVHPTASPDPAAHTMGLTDNLIDYPIDTTRTVAQLHYSGTFSRTPDVQYIFSHAGGAIPYLAGRFAIVDEMGIMGEELPPASESFERIYYDTALAWADPILHAVDAVAGAQQLLFGTDFPYIRPDLAKRAINHVANTDELGPKARHLVLGGNANELFPRLAARAST